MEISASIQRGTAVNAMAGITTAQRLATTLRSAMTLEQLGHRGRIAWAAFIGGVFREDCDVDLVEVEAVPLQLALGDRG